MGSQHARPVLFLVAGLLVLFLRKITNPIRKSGNIV